jgi:programmed cell death 6-interacting protein
MQSESRHRSAIWGSVDFSRELQVLKLPAALDALDKPIGLPPSLLQKAEEVRLENGPERAEKLLEDVQTLARRARAILTEVGAHF